jgi:hypothetical protein
MGTLDQKIALVTGRRMSYDTKERGLHVLRVVRHLKGGRS